MISDVYFPRINGVSTSIKTFREELTELGHEITLIAPDYPNHTETDPSIIRIDSRYLFFDPEDRLMKRKLVSSLKHELANKNFDILHIQTPFMAHYAGLELSKALNIPRIVTYHTHFEEYLTHYFPFVPKAFVKKAARWFNRHQCNDVDSVIVPSTAMLNILKDYDIHKPIEIIATGIDEHFFTPGNGQRFKDKYNIDINRPVLVHIGRLAHEKNIDFLLTMIVELRKTIPDVLLVIAGEGPAKEHLVKLSKSLGIENNITFVGYLDRETNLHDCYCAGDVFIFASKTETQGLVLLEAMAQKIPVVSLAILGTKDILDAGKGVIVAEEDIHDFSEKISRVLKSSELQNKMSKEAYEYARTWTSKAFAEKKQSFYEKAIKQYY
jgi:glycosyltransferase involved in cell wall biosynthesis